MKQFAKSTIVLSFLLVLVGCGPLETKARDTIAGMKGLLDSEQAARKAQCSVDPSAPVCQALIRGAGAENALVTATETYCGWSTLTPPTLDAVCAPNKALAPALKNSIDNALRIISEIKKAGGK